MPGHKSHPSRWGIQRARRRPHPPSLQAASPSGFVTSTSCKVWDPQVAKSGTQAPKQEPPSGPVQVCSSIWASSPLCYLHWEVAQRSPTRPPPRKPGLLGPTSNRKRDAITPSPLLHVGMEFCYRGLKRVSLELGQKDRPGATKVSQNQKALIKK